jgi:large subunit ribosomal protein L25
MESQTLKAEVRTQGGKGPARQLRMKGLIPAVFYGPGKSPASLTVSPADVTKLLGGDFGRNQIVTLEFGGGKELAVVRDLEVDPLSRKILHVDFYSVSRERPVKARVPFVANGRAAGVAAGGVLRVIYRDLPVIGAPDKIPSKIEVDVTALEMHQAIRVKDLALPAGVTVAYPPDRPVVSVETKEKEVPEEGEAVPGAVPGAPGAPAAAGAAAPAAAGGKDAKAAPAAKGAAPAAKAAAPAKDDKKKK